MTPQVSDTAKFDEMAQTWSTLQNPEDEELKRRWIDAFTAMSASQRQIVSKGEWVSGPSSILSVLGLSRAEVIYCRMVRWLFDPLAWHGIGKAMIQSLADHLNFKVDDLDASHATVEELYEDTRADLVLRVGGREIVFEAKIDAPEQPDQGRRIEARWPGADRLVFLTTGQPRRPNTAKDRDRWQWLSWQWIAKAADVHMNEPTKFSDERAAAARDAVRAWTYDVRRNLR